MHWTVKDYKMEDQLLMVVDAFFGPEMGRL
jgi:hypothetical protein